MDVAGRGFRFAVGSTRTQGWYCRSKHIAYAIVLHKGENTLEIVESQSQGLLMVATRKYVNVLLLVIHGCI